MGSMFKLGIVSKDKDFATELLEIGIKEIERIEDLLSEFRVDSMTSKINEDAGIAPTLLNKEVFGLIERSLQISQISNGAFDITIGPLKKLYQFNNSEFDFPKAGQITKALKGVGYEKVKLDASSLMVKLKEPGMRISFAAIGKGYAADQVRKIWKSLEVESGYINASGDLCAFGKNEESNPWTIGIANPNKKNTPLLHLVLRDRAIATSGDYEQFFMHMGKRYSHSLNPKTGLPLSGIKSVSVISPSAELSDGLATAVYTLGEKAGISFVNSLPQTHAIVINEKDEVHFSEDIDYEGLL